MYALVGHKAKSNCVLSGRWRSERADDGGSQDGGDLGGALAGRESGRTGEFDGLHDSFEE